MSETSPMFGVARPAAGGGARQTSVQIIGARDVGQDDVLLVGDADLVEAVALGQMSAMHAIHLTRRRIARCLPPMRLQRDRSPMA